MSNLDIVKTGMQAFAAGDVTALSSLIAEDFVFSGPVPQPIGKTDFLNLCRANHSAFPDFNFNARDFREEGDNVYVTTAITGTHTGPLALIPNIPAVPPTGKRIQLPDERHTYMLKDGLLVRLDVQSRPDGGIPAAYAQVGAPLPQMS